MTRIEQLEQAVEEFRSLYPHLLSQCSTEMSGWLCLPWMSSQHLSRIVGRGIGQDDPHAAELGIGKQDEHARW